MRSRKLFEVEKTQARSDTDSTKKYTPEECFEIGRPVLLGRELDDKVQAYLTKVREAGGAVSM